MLELPDGNDLGHSRPLPLDRVANGDNLKAALEALLVHLKETEGPRKRQRRSDDEARLVAILDAIVCDLFANHRSDPKRFLAYSRNRSDYTQQSRYMNSLTSLTSVVAAADFLISQGYAQGARGFYSRKANPFGGPAVTSGMRSRIRATEKLIQFLEGDHGASTMDIGYRSGFEAIRLKDNDKKLEEYDDTEATSGMRSFLAHYNETIARCDIQFDNEESLLSSDGTKPDFSAKHLYRVFNNGRFDQGGRFYGGWWQRINQERRSHIIIDGEETVEIDYSAMHCRMCYDLSGKPLSQDVDPYLIPGFEQLRDAVKFAFLVLFNLSPGQRARASDKVKVMIKNKSSFRDLLLAVERHHQPIKQWFRSSRGTELQCIDSKVASSVMGFCVGQNIPCLSIHDSFIVPSSARKQLEHAMRHAYAAHVRTPTNQPCYPVLK